MTDAELPHASDTYVRTIESANMRWKAEADTLDGQYALRLARQDTDQSPAALHSHYLRQRGAGRLIWQRAMAAAIDTYRQSIGETGRPSIGVVCGGTKAKVGHPLSSPNCKTGRTDQPSFRGGH